MKCANKKQILLIFTILHFFKKRVMKNNCRYHYQNLNDMIYSSWDIEQNKLKLVILGHFLPFISIKTLKIIILKNEKIYWIYHHFTHVHQKSQSYDVRFLRYRVRETKNFIILDHVLPFYLSACPNDPKYQNFEKIWKNAWRYYSFIHTCVP